MKSIVDYTNKLKDYFATKQDLTNKYLFVGRNRIEITADGVKTNKTLIYEAITALRTYLTSNTDISIIIVGGGYGSQNFIAEVADELFSSVKLPSQIRMANTVVSSGSYILRDMDFNTTLESNTYNVCTNGTTVSEKETVATSGQKIRIYFEIYKQYT